jgi:hypothetical protein
MMLPNRCDPTSIAQCVLFCVCVAVAAPLSWLYCHSGLLLASFKCTHELIGTDPYVSMQDSLYVPIQRPNGVVGCVLSRGDALNHHHPSPALHPHPRGLTCSERNSVG